MEKDKLDIDKLITGRFLGTNSEEEDLVLENWIGMTLENRRYYSEQQKLWGLIEIHQKMQKIDEVKAFQKISGQLPTNKKVSLYVWVQRIAAALFLPLLLVTAVYFNKEKRDRKQLATVYNTVETPLGMRSSLVLPDGTKVCLNAGSKLSYPVSFSNDNRLVNLSGEAYFEVKKDKSWPFIVNTKNMDIVVTGTSFNCNAYPENKEVQTVLVEGEVTIANHSATKLALMSPGELATFNNDNQQITKTKTDLQKYIAWKNGKLMFREDNMDKVVEKLERWYNVDFEIVDKEIADYVYTATFINESLDQVLKMLSISSPIRYTISERKKQNDDTFERAVVKLYKNI